jgi:hypothetical protein
VSGGLGGDGFRRSGQQRQLAVGIVEADSEAAHEFVSEDRLIGAGEVRGPVGRPLLDRNRQCRVDDVETADRRPPNPLREPAIAPEVVSSSDGAILGTGFEPQGARLLFRNPQVVGSARVHDEPRGSRSEPNLQSGAMVAQPHRNDDLTGRRGIFRHRVPVGVEKPHAALLVVDFDDVAVQKVASEHADVSERPPTGVAAPRIDPELEVATENGGFPVEGIFRGPNRHSDASGVPGRHHR